MSGFTKMKRARETNNWQLDCTEMKQRGEFLFRTKLWSDIVFQFENKKFIKAHKLLLAMASPVFGTMFYDNAFMNPVKISDVPVEVFNVLLEYIYSDNIQIPTLDYACDLYYAGRNYKMPYITQVCVQYLSRHINHENVCHIYEVAYLSGEDALQEACLNIFRLETKRVLNSDRFTHAEQQTVAKMFSLENLDIDSELDLYIAAVKYADAHDARDYNMLEYISMASDSSDDTSPAKRPRLSFSEDFSVSKDSGNSSKESQNNLTKESGKCNRDNERKSKYKNIVQEIRFLTLTPAEFAECKLLQSLLTEEQILALSLNIASKDTPVKMPEGFSYSMVPRSWSTRRDRQRISAKFHSTIHNVATLKKFESIPFYIRNTAWTFLMINDLKSCDRDEQLGVAVTCYLDNVSPDWLSTVRVKVKFYSKDTSSEHMEVTLNRQMNAYKQSRFYGIWTARLSWIEITHPFQPFVEDNTLTYKVSVFTEDKEIPRDMNASVSENTTQGQNQNVATTSKIMQSALNSSPQATISGVRPLSSANVVSTFQKLDTKPISILNANQSAKSALNATTDPLQTMIPDVKRIATSSNTMSSTATSQGRAMNTLTSSNPQPYKKLTTLNTNMKIAYKPTPLISGSPQITMCGVKPIASTSSVLPSAINSQCISKSTAPTTNVQICTGSMSVSKNTNQITGSKSNENASTNALASQHQTLSTQDTSKSSETDQSVKQRIKDISGNTRSSSPSTQSLQEIRSVPVTSSSIISATTQVSKTSENSGKYLTTSLKPDSSASKTTVVTTTAENIELNASSSTAVQVQPKGSKPNAPDLIIKAPTPTKSLVSTISTLYPGIVQKASVKATPPVCASNAISKALPDTTPSLSSGILQSSADLKLALRISLQSTNSPVGVDPKLTMLTLKPNIPVSTSVSKVGLVQSSMESAKSLPSIADVNFNSNEKSSKTIDCGNTSLRDETQLKAFRNLLLTKPEAQIVTPLTDDLKSAISSINVPSCYQETTKIVVTSATTFLSTPDVTTVTPSSASSSGIINSVKAKLSRNNKSTPFTNTTSASSQIEPCVSTYKSAENMQNYGSENSSTSVLRESLKAQGIPSCSTFINNTQKPANNEKDTSGLLDASSDDKRFKNSSKDRSVSTDCDIPQAASTPNNSILTAANISEALSVSFNTSQDSIDSATSKISGVVPFSPNKRPQEIKEVVDLEQFSYLNQLALDSHPNASENSSTSLFNLSDISPGAVTTTFSLDIINSDDDAANAPPSKKVKKEMIEDTVSAKKNYNVLPPSNKVKEYMTENIMSDEESQNTKTTKKVTNEITETTICAENFGNTPPSKKMKKELNEIIIKNENVGNLMSENEDDEQMEDFFVRETGLTLASPSCMPTSPLSAPTSSFCTPTSPFYTPASSSYRSMSPGYTYKSPSYTPVSPAYTAKSPLYTPASPGYTQKSPSYTPASSLYTHKSPSYTTAIPEYTSVSSLNVPMVVMSPSHSPTSLKILSLAVVNTNVEYKHRNESQDHEDKSSLYIKNFDISPSTLHTLSLAVATKAVESKDISPRYTHKSPLYTQASPGYTHKTPSYTPVYSHSPTSLKMLSLAVVNTKVESLHTLSLAVVTKAIESQDKKEPSTYKSSSYRPESPVYTHKSPFYTLTSSECTGRSPSYTPAIPEYMSVSSLSVPMAITSPSHSPSSLLILSLAAVNKKVEYKHKKESQVHESKSSLYVKNFDISPSSLQNLSLSVVRKAVESEDDEEPNNHENKFSLHEKNFEI